MEIKSAKVRNRTPIAKDNLTPAACLMPTLNSSKSNFDCVGRGKKLLLHFLSQTTSRSLRN